VIGGGKEGKGEKMRVKKKRTKGIASTIQQRLSRSTGAPDSFGGGKFPTAVCEDRTGAVFIEEERLRPTCYKGKKRERTESLEK